VTGLSVSFVRFRAPLTALSVYTALVEGTRSQCTDLSSWVIVSRKADCGAELALTVRGNFVLRSLITPGRFLFPTLVSLSRSGTSKALQKMLLEIAVIF
jgi:hypothetical protein